MGSWGNGELAQLVKPLSRRPEDLSLSSRTHTKCQSGQRVLETRAVGDGRQKWDLRGSPASLISSLKLQADKRSFLNQKLKGT